MNGPEVCMVGCWILFVLYWSVSAFSVKRAADRQPWIGILAHRAPTLSGYVLLFWPKPPYPLSLRLTSGNALPAFIGAGLCCVGLLTAIWARKILGRNWSSTVLFKEEHELIEKGPYRFVRHPIYTGILAMSFGSALVVGRLGAWVGVLLVLGGFWIKLRQEERLLTRYFPTQYPGYITRVKALIPFVL